MEAQKGVAVVESEIVHPDPFEALSDRGTDEGADRWLLGACRQSALAELSARELMGLWHQRRVRQTVALRSSGFPCQLGKRPRNVKMNCLVCYPIFEHLRLGWSLLRCGRQAAQGRQNQRA
jgi:hypothetical protein